MKVDQDDPRIKALPPIIEHVPAVVFRLSHKQDTWHTWFVTENISQFGYTVKEFMADEVCWFDIVHPDDRVLVSKTVADYEAHSINSFKLYYRIVAKNGDVIPVTEYNTVNRDENGDVFCYDTAIVSNSQSDDSRRIIDDHYRQQVVLNDILMSLHDSNPDNALQIILDRTGAYLDTSRALLFRDSPDHKTCKVVYEWCNKDIESVMALDYSITYETGMPEIYIALQTTGNLIIDFGEIPENCKEEFEAEGLIASAIFAIYLDGDHYGFVCFDDCVVERHWDDDTVRFLKNISNIISTVLARQAEADKLAQNRKTYETVLDNVDSYIFVTQPQSGQLIFANRAFKATFGNDCVGQDVGQYLDVASVRLVDSTADEADYPELWSEKSGEWLAVTRDEITWVDGSCARLFNCYDITAKKRFSDTLEQRVEERTRQLQQKTVEADRAREQAEEAARAKSRFLANMSHEIRTPLNAITGLSELLASDELNKRQQEHIRNIRSSSGILLGIINDILDISKLETGNLVLAEVNYSLEKTMDHISSLLRVMCDEKDISYAFTASRPLDICLYGDDLRLRQILLNLLSNAVKFTKQGTVTLAVDVGDDEISFQVSDTGMGIRPEDMPSLFEAFSQADIHKNRNQQGTGLGLAICKNLADLMGGTITAESEYGKGSTFTLRIPRVEGDASFLEKSAGENLVLAQYAPGTRVLVVDDIDINLYVAEAMLEEFGIKAALAHSGAEAVDLAASQPFDLIFMDHMMPGMDGTEATRRIRALGGTRGKTPVIALTANAMTEARDGFYEAGMNDFLAKPIEVEKMNTILERWLPKDKRL